MSHYVLIQEPRREGVYVKCASLDQCMSVVDEETRQNLPGTRITMFRKRPRQTAKLLAMWRIERGGVRRYRVNPLRVGPGVRAPRSVIDAIADDLDCEVVA